MEEFWERIEVLERSMGTDEGGVATCLVESTEMCVVEVLKIVQQVRGRLETPGGKRADAGGLWTKWGREGR